MSNEGQRFAIVEMSPPWFQQGVSKALLYVYGLMLDIILDKWSMAIINRLPTQCDPSALPILGTDRVLTQGPTEPNASFRVRLQRAFDTWRFAGSARSIMSECLAFVLPAVPRMRIVKENAVSGGVAIWDTYGYGADPQAPPSHKVVVDDWDWDGAIIKWRLWFIIYSTGGTPWPTEGTWGDGDVWGDASKVWGIGTPIGTIQGLRSLLKQRKSAGSWYLGGVADPTSGGIIISFSDSLFDPTQAAGGGVNPDGNWGHFGKDVAGEMVPARFDNARYVDGTT